MNWWIIGYIILYMGLLLFSLWDDISSKEPLWYIVLNVLCDASAISFIVAYWLIPSLRIYGALWLILFLFSLGWVILTTPHELKKNGMDAEMKTKEGKAVLFVGFLFATLLCAPAYFWGGMLAWNYLK